MNTHYMLLIGEGAWRIVSAAADDVRVEFITAAADAPIEAKVEATAAQLTAMGCADKPLVLALESPACLCANVSMDNLDRSGRDREMAYRLEEHLPVSAEDVVAAFADAVDREAMGVCVELHRLEPIVRACEVAGIDVQHICPVALLAAAGAVEQERGVAGVLIGPEVDAGGSTGYDFVELNGGKPVRWWWLHDDRDALADRLAAWAMSHDGRPKLAVIGKTPSIDELIGAVPNVEKCELVGDRECAAASHAAKLIAGAATPWIDLRRGALAAVRRHGAIHKQAALLVAAIVLLMVCVGGVMEWRGRQYGVLAADYRHQQVDLFKIALPEQRVPTNIKARLESEARKYAGLGGQATDDAVAQVLGAPSGLAQLRDILVVLPTDAPYRILDLSIEPDLVRVDGQAGDHADAERLATALRQTGAYEVEPPRTQALRDRGVSFLFTATPHSAASETGARP